MIERVKRWLFPDLVSPSEECLTKMREYSEDFNRGFQEGLSGSNETCSWKIVDPDPAYQDYSDWTVGPPVFDEMTDIDKLVACLEDIGASYTQYMHKISIDLKHETVYVHFDADGMLKEDLEL